MRRKAVNLLKREVVNQTMFCEHCRVTGNLMFAYANNNGELELSHSPIGSYQRGFKKEVAYAKWTNKGDSFYWSIWEKGKREPASVIYTEADGVLDMEDRRHFVIEQIEIVKGFLEEQGIILEYEFEGDIIKWEVGDEKYEDTITGVYRGVQAEYDTHGAKPYKFF